MFVEEKRNAEPIAIEALLVAANFIEAPIVIEPWRGVLLIAADYIEQHGWCQGGWTDGERVCALQAIRLQDSLYGSNAQNKLRDFLGRDVATWNDRKGRTQQEVTATLRACAGC